MNTTTHILTRALAALAFTCIALPAFAKSGEFTYVTGEVTVRRGTTAAPAKVGDEVNAGDVIVTGAEGMAQLKMIDDARLSLRSNTELTVRAYASKKDSGDNVLLELARGTLRAFTGLLTKKDSSNFKMKTRAATVGIRGSGNLLIADGDVTINHTIEGGHIVTANEGNFAPIITIPNQTVRVVFGQAPMTIPTPPNLLDAGKIMVGTKSTEAVEDGGDTKLPPRGPESVPNQPVVGGNGLGYTIIDASANLTADPLNLQQVVLAGNGGTIGTLAAPDGITLENGNLRRVASYVGEQSGLNVGIAGGTAADVQTITIGGTTVVLGRWNGATGAGSGAPTNIHWAYGGAGFPSYLSEVLTGTVSYTRAGATTPTNQLGTLGQLTSSILDVNFTARTLNATIGVSMPGNATTAAGAWTLTAANVPFSLNSFFAYTGGGRLTITNNNGQSSAGNPALTGTLQGGFVGSALNGAIVGYGFTDGSNRQNVQTINGIVAFQGPAQNLVAAYRNGLISDPTGALNSASFIRSYATVNRPDEVTHDDQGRVSAFAGPIAQGVDIIGHAPYTQGTASVLDNGFDASTGLVWGRWAGGAANIRGQSVALTNRSLHYIFSSAQSGPTALPLTGSAVYDVIGSTRPTDLNGNVGTFNNASLNANFSARTVSTSLNISIAGQTWNAAANNVPIYRDQYFSAYAGSVQGVPSPATLVLTCTPNCTPASPTGSLDGFFTGRTGQGAGVMYNLNSNISGAIAFRRRG